MASNIYTDPAIASALERGDTLPARWYVEADVFQAEKERHLPSHVAVRRAYRAGVERRAIFSRRISATCPS